MLIQCHPCNAIRIFLSVCLFLSPDWIFTGCYWSDYIYTREIRSGECAQNVQNLSFEGKLIEVEEGL